MTAILPSKLFGSTLVMKNIVVVSVLQILLTKSLICGAQGLYDPPEYSEETEALLLPLSYYDENFEIKGDELEKRHLGSVTAYRDKPQRQPSLLQDLIKRHLGSIAAKSTRIPQEAEKRHFGSLASKSGFVSEGRALRGGTEEKRNVASLAKLSSKPLKRDEVSGVDDYSGENQDHFLEYPVDPYFQEGFQDEPITFKNKRFLGSLARGGWFPRQFRGFVAENPYEKRHIGSAARVGWIPLSKLDREGGLGFGPGAEFKRNIQSLRRLHQNPPTNAWGWGRQRDTRMTH